MKFVRNKYTGILEVWDNEEYMGPIITTGDILYDSQYIRRSDNEWRIVMDIHTFKEFTDRQYWVFAKTYANKAPHEYIVRGRINGIDEEFMAAVNYIQEHGITMHYWNHPNKYVFLDGRQYWVMRNSEDDPTTIMNRCNCDDYKYTITWQGRK